MASNSAPRAYAHVCFMANAGDDHILTVLYAHRPIIDPEEGNLIERGICPLCWHDLAIIGPKASGCIECGHGFEWQGEYAYAIFPV